MGKRSLNIFAKIVGAAGFAAFAFVALSFGFAKNAHAADSPATNGLSITISPVVVRPEITAGQTTTSQFTVTNNGTIDYDFNIYAQPYSVADGSYTQDFAKQTKFSQISRWITFSGKNTQTYHLAKGASKEINYTIATPASIPDGSQYAVIFAQTITPNPNSGQSGIQANQRVGLLVYAKSANGHTINSGEVASNDLGKLTTTNGVSSFAKKDGNLYDAAPVAAITSVKNTGNTDFQVETQSKLVGVLWGGTTTSAKSSRSVLPDTTFQATDVLCKDNTNDTGITSGDSTSGAHCSVPFVGLFNLTTTVSMLGKTYTYKHFVVIFPLWLLIAIIVVIVLVVGLIIWRKSRKNSRNAKKSAKIKSASGMKLRK
jgi:hypothetical protein